MKQFQNVLVHMRTPKLVLGKTTEKAKSPPATSSNFVVKTAGPTSLPLETKELDLKDLEIFISSKSTKAKLPKVIDVADSEFFVSPISIKHLQPVQLDAPVVKAKKLLPLSDLRPAIFFKGKKFYKLIDNESFISFKSDKLDLSGFEPALSIKGKKLFKLADLDCPVSVKSAHLFGDLSLEPTISLGSKKSQAPFKLVVPKLSHAVRVGIWDLGAWLGQLPALLDAMNKAQSRYEFLVVEAMSPVGFIRDREGVIPWIEQQIGQKLKSTDAVGQNVIANDFFGIADTVRKGVAPPVDYLVGITPSMVAGEDEEEVYWNHFSTFEGRCVLASTYDLRKYAKKTGKPFEAFLGGIIIAQTLVAQFWNGGLNFHTENRGCLFDYNGDRVSLMEKVKDLHIEPECLEKIPPGFRDTALALVKFLRDY